MRISTISYDDSQDDLRSVYAEVLEKRGKLSNIMRIQSLNPRAMRAHMDLYMSIMFGKSGLRRAERELIATVVSATNKCSYCISHHAEALAHYWKDDERVAHIRESEFDQAGLDDRQMAMVSYAIALTEDPSSVGDDDVAALGGAGLSDSEILDLTLIISYFNFVNRIAEGLGVDFDENEVAGYNY